eukprot:TRINITY_DN2725_c2_g1_i1.p1 TRINITY_DN2725_c2_g1~~TRINITY_DN2725_c2_g1_i1.p1  ORF type:complete len:485 (+),score=20.88 TRINITY_DN2725_c2_g1_i1:227-1681(+)
MKYKKLNIKQQTVGLNLKYPQTIILVIAIIATVYTMLIVSAKLAFISIQVDSQANSQSCKIGVINFVDFIDEEKSYINDKLRPCLDQQYKPPLISSSEQYYFVNYSHITNGTTIDPHLESLMILNQISQPNKQLVNIEEADLIFVNDFCYLYQFRPGYKISNELKESIIFMFDSLRSSNRWKKRNGSDFVFVRAYPSEKGLFTDEYICQYLSNSFHVLYEWQQFFGKCGNQELKSHKYMPKKNKMKQQDLKTITMPYFTNLMPRIVPEINQRNILVSFVGSCALPFTEDSAGNVFRRILYEDLNSVGNDVQFFCPCIKQKGQKRCVNEVSHQQALQISGNSKFCFIIAGDSLSSKRLTETVLKGCVPVFVGSPFHALPHVQRIDYSQFGLFFKLKYNVKLQLFAPSRVYLQDKFVPQKSVISVNSPREIVYYLRKISNSRYTKMFSYVKQQRSLFEFVPNPSGYPSSIDAILEDLCEVYHKQVK